MTKIRQYRWLLSFSAVLFIAVLYFGFGTLQVNKVDVGAATTVTWDGGGDGLTWNDANNWDINTVPTSTSLVEIDSSEVWVGAGQTADFATLAVGDGISAATLVMYGTFDSAGSITVAGSSTLSQANTSGLTITGTLTVQSNGALAHLTNSTTHLYNLDITAATIDLQSGSTVNLDGLGFRGGDNSGNQYGYGPGRGRLDGQSADGASHGGNGGESNLNNNIVAPRGYCDYTNPTTLGSGGDAGLVTMAIGGHGGGLIRLEASGTLTVDGTISVDGTDGENGFFSTYNGGAGAGGAVRLKADTIAGSGTITATGGDGDRGHSGGGGGGCVSIEYTTSNSFSDLSSVTINGGGANAYEYGGGGILYISQVSGSNSLYVDNNDTAGAETENAVSSTSFSTIVITDEALFNMGSGNTTTISGTSPFSSGDATGTFILSDNSTTTFSSINDFTIASTTLRIEDGSAIEDNTNLDLTVGNAGTLDLYNYTTSTDPLTIENLTVASGGTFTHGDNSTAQTHIINLSAQTVTVASGGTIDVDEKGYDGGEVDSDGNGPGAGVYGLDFSGSGAGHMGAGGGDPEGDSGGAAYCDISDPDTIGSGGGGGAANVDIGGHGGGLVILDVAGTFTLAGTVTADGGHGTSTFFVGYNSGGGAGGGVKITADTLTGSGGTITATGGEGQNTDSGGGGGGCVFLNYTTTSTIATSTVTVTGGTGDSYENGEDGQLAIPPIVSSVSASPLTDGTGGVTVGTSVENFGKQDLSLKVEYVSGACTYSGQATSTVSSTVSVETGSAPTVDNNDANGRQIQAIDMSGLTNSVTSTWLSASDDSSADGTYCVFLTPYNGIVEGTTASTTVTLDNVAPSAPGALTLSAASLQSAIVTFGATSTDTNFSEYKIFHATTTPLSESDTAITSSTDSNLGSATYGGASTTTISSLTTSTITYATIYAYDTYGNSTSSTSELNFYTLADTPSGVSATVDSTSAISVSWGTATNPSGVDFGATISGDGSNSDCSYSADKTSCTFSNLSSGTAYTITVSARNGDAVLASAASVSATTDSAGAPGPPSNPPPPPTPPDDPECDPLTQTCEPDPENPSGLIIINDGDTYTNNLDVTITFDTEFVDEYALSDSPDFEGETFAPIVSSVEFTLPDAQGEQTVYAKFRKTGDDGNIYTYDAQDIIIVDTIPPDPPDVTYISHGLLLDPSDGKFYMNNPNGWYIQPTIKGQSEPDAIIEIEKWHNLDAEDFPEKFLKYGESHEFFYSESTKANGNWTLHVPHVLFPVPTVLVFKAIDLAGNESNTLGTEADLTEGDEKCPDCEEIPPCFDTDCEPLPLPECENGICELPDEPELPEDPEEELPCEGPDCEEELPEEPLCEGAECQDPDELPPETPPTIPPTVPTGPGPTSGDGGSNGDSGSSGTGGGALLSTTTPLVTTPGESTSSTIIERIETVLEDTAEVVLQAALQVADFVVEIIDDPRVEAANEAVVAPSIAVAVAVNTVGFQLPNAIAYIRFLFSQPLMLLRRRKQKKWGVVYNAFTKQPVDLATVRLIAKESGSVVRTQVTDAQGRFFLAADPGKYTIEVFKTGYTGFSEYLKELNEDSNFINLYHGEDIDVGEEGLEINFNIPLDPEAEQKSTASVLKDHAKKGFQKLFSVLGLGMAFVSFVISPKPWIGGLLVLHVGLFFLFRRLSRKKIAATFGKVVDAIGKKPLGKVVVRIFDAAYDKLINTVVTDHQGRYAALVGPSTYYVTYELKGYEKKKSEDLDFSSDKTGGIGGIIARDEALEKAGKGTSAKKEKMGPKVTDEAKAPANKKEVVAKKPKKKITKKIEKSPRKARVKKEQPLKPEEVPTQTPEQAEPEKQPPQKEEQTPSSPQEDEPKMSGKGTVLEDANDAIEQWKKDQGLD